MRGGRHHFHIIGRRRDARERIGAGGGSRLRADQCIKHVAGVIAIVAIERDTHTTQACFAHIAQAVIVAIIPDQIADAHAAHIDHIAGSGRAAKGIRHPHNHRIGRRRRRRSAKCGSARLEGKSRGQRAAIQRPSIGRGATTCSHHLIIDAADISVGKHWWR